MADTVHVDLGRPMPLFPFPDLVLLPHERLPLHVFEPRYRQMVATCMADGSRMFAVGTFDMPRGGGLDPGAAPPLRPAVCVGRITEHVPLPDGRCHLVLHGLCRARVTRLHEPDGRRLFRTADCVPIDPTEGEEPDDAGHRALERLRRRVKRVLGRRRFDPVRQIGPLREWLRSDEVPSRILPEVIGFALVHDTDSKYRLLACPSLHDRVRLVEDEVTALDRLIAVTAAQHAETWPKGMSWN